MCLCKCKGTCKTQFCPCRLLRSLGLKTAQEEWREWAAHWIPYIATIDCVKMKVLGVESGNGLLPSIHWVEQVDEKAQASCSYEIVEHRETNSLCKRLCFVLRGPQIMKTWSFNLGIWNFAYVSANLLFRELSLRVFLFRYMSGLNENFKIW